MNPTGEELRALAAEVGCHFSAEVVDGYQLGTCPSGPAKVALLDLLASWDARHDAAALEQARAIRSRAGGDVGAIARALHAWVRANIAFLYERVETFQSSMQTLQLRSGDCDCQARLLAAMARSIGLGARFVDFGDPEDPSHVAVLLWDGSAWRWAETTVGAAFGEEPTAAAARLGLQRPDIRRTTAASSPAYYGAGAAGLGAVSSEYETASAGILGALGASPEQMAQLSPMVRIGVEVTNMALASTGGSVVGAAASAAAEGLGLGAATIAELGQSIGALAEMVPLFGQVVGLAIEYGGAAGGADIAQEAKNCQAGFRAPIPTGPNGLMMPVDLFIYAQPEGPNKRRTDLGWLMHDLAHYQGDLALARKLLDAPSLGIPERDRKLLAEVGDAIQLAYLREDGGRAIWPLWIDTLYRLIKEGRVTPSYLRYVQVMGQLDRFGMATGTYHFSALAAALYETKHRPDKAALSWSVLPPNDDDNRIACARFDDRAVRQLLDMQRVWGLTAFSPYVLDGSVSRETPEALEKARKLLEGDSPLRIRFRVARKAKSRAPLVVAGLGVAGAGAAAFVTRDLWLPALSAAWRRAVRG